jgi:hypothetical protein
MKNNKYIILNSVLLSIILTYLTSFSLLFGTNDVVNINSNFVTLPIVILIIIYFYICKSLLTNYHNRISSVFNKKSFNNLQQKIILIFTGFVAIIIIYLFFKSFYLFGLEDTYNWESPVNYNITILRILFFISIVILLITESLILRKLNFKFKLIFKHIILPQ